MGWLQRFFNQGAESHGDPVNPRSPGDAQAAANLSAEIRALISEIKLLREGLAAGRGPQFADSGRRRSGNRRDRDRHQQDSQSTNNGNNANRDRGPRRGLPKTPPEDAPTGLLVDYLKTRDVVVFEGQDDLANNEAFEHLARHIGQHFHLVAPFYEKLKRSVATGRFTRVDIDGLSDHERSAAVQLGTLLHRHGLLKDFYYHRSPKKLLRVIPTSDGETAQFLTGGWLEIYVSWLLERKLKARFSPSKFQILFNVKGTLPDSREFEADLMAWVDDKMIWVECKTGNWQDYSARFRGLVKIFGNDRSTAALLLIRPPDASTRGRASDLLDMTLVSMNEIEPFLNRAMGLPEEENSIRPRVVERPIRGSRSDNRAGTASGRRRVATRSNVAEAESSSAESSATDKRLVAKEGDQASSASSDGESGGDAVTRRRRRRRGRLRPAGMVSKEPGARNTRSASSSSESSARSSHGRNSGTSGAKTSGAKSSSRAASGSRSGQARPAPSGLSRSLAERVPIQPLEGADSPADPTAQAEGKPDKKLEGKPERKPAGAKDSQRASSVKAAKVDAGVERRGGDSAKADADKKTKADTAKKVIERPVRSSAPRRQSSTKSTGQVSEGERAKAEVEAQPKSAAESSKVPADSPVESRDSSTTTSAESLSPRPRRRTRRSSPFHRTAGASTETNSKSDPNSDLSSEVQNRSQNRSGRSDASQVPSPSERTSSTDSKPAQAKQSVEETAPKTKASGTTRRKAGSRTATKADSKPEEVSDASPKADSKRESAAKKSTKSDSASKSIAASEIKEAESSKTEKASGDSGKRRSASGPALGSESKAEVPTSRSSKAATPKRGKGTSTKKAEEASAAVVTGPSAAEPTPPSSEKNTAASKTTAAKNGDSSSTDSEQKAGKKSTSGVTIAPELAAMMAKVPSKSNEAD